jgi:inositol transport system permease protein
VGALAGVVNGGLIARTGIPPFIATLGMMVTARGLERAYTGGQALSMLSDQYSGIGSGYNAWTLCLTEGEQVNATKL